MHTLAAYTLQTIFIIFSPRVCDSVSGALLLYASIIKMFRFCEFKSCTYIVQIERNPTVPVVFATNQQVEILTGQGRLPLRTKSLYY